MAKPENGNKRISALLTCHNRKEQTLSCLSRLAAQELPSDVDVSIVLVDDGSGDGTADAVTAAYPNADVLHGDGSLFWCGGLRKAWRHAADSDPDYYLLLNDDTLLYPDAVRALLGIVESPESRRIGVAVLVDPYMGEHTYGGVRGENNRVPPTGQVEACDTFNANAVLVPRAVYLELGVFYDGYTHAMGDFDYGYQATRNGIKVLQSASPLGECARNLPVGTWKDASLGRCERLRKLQAPKGLPWREWVVYNRRNGGSRWMLRCISPMIRILVGR